MATNSLQEITDAWGAWLAGRLPGGPECVWTETTDYAARSQLNAFIGYQVRPSPTVISYELVSSETTPIAADEVNEVNDYPEGQSWSATLSGSTTDTLSFQVVKQMRITWTVSERITMPPTPDLPIMVSERGQYTHQRSFTNATTYTTSKTKSWSASMTVAVSANSKSVATLSIGYTTATYNWSGVNELFGSCAILFNKAVQLYSNRPANTLWFVWLPQVFVDCAENDLIDLEGYTFAAPTGQADGFVHALTSGTFLSQAGVTQIVNVSETPLS